MRVMKENFKHLYDENLIMENDIVVPKVPVFVGNDITSESYYFKPSQVLKYHRHPHGEQIFFFIEGEGVMKLDDGTEEVVLPVKAGSTVFVPTGVWHEIVNSNEGRMVAVQATKAGAGVEQREM